MSAASSPRLEKLEAWQASHQLTLNVYQATKLMPASERFGLTAQMRRAAVSIASNYLPVERIEELRAAVDHAGRLVWGLYRGLGGVVASKS